MVFLPGSLTTKLKCLISKTITVVKEILFMYIEFKDDMVPEISRHRLSKYSEKRFCSDELSFIFQPILDLRIY